jgi:acetyl-CoA acetyltransferase
MKDIVIVEGARTPMAEYNGQFSDISAIGLAASPSAGALRQRSERVVVQTADLFAYRERLSPD